MSKISREIVLKENAKAHDDYAELHDLNVPYISRKNTRRYYWDLIISALDKEKINLDNVDVCEIGCGTGTFLNLFLEKNVNKYVGVDLSKKMIEFAKKKNKSKKAIFFCDSLEDFSKQNIKKFDVIISSSFLHHLYDFDQSLMDIKSMLKPGGIYLGLHEPLDKYKAGFIEKVDRTIAYILGYNGQRKKTLFRRLFGVFIYLPLKLVFKRKKESKKEIDLIDYQMNFGFDLKKLAKGKGKTVVYSYYNIPELRFLERIFKKPKNYAMLIMKP